MLDELVVVVAVAAVVPLALAAVPRVAVPASVVEILVGVVLGPGVLALVAPDEAVRVLATIGLSFLLFLAGLEIDLDSLRGRAAGQAGRGLVLSLIVAALVGAVLQVTGRVSDGRLIAVLLVATSLGLVVPVLRDAGLTERPLGRRVLAGSSMGELAALLLLSLTFSTSSRGSGAGVLLLALLAAVAGAVVIGGRWIADVPGVVATVKRLADTSAQVRVRLAMLLVVGMAALAETLGFESILGAFLAGVVLQRADPHGSTAHPHFRVKLEGLGFGFLVPVFFVSSGLAFDVEALRDASPVQVPLFLLALLAVRAVPALAYRPELPWRDVVAAGLLQATSLPFLVAGAAIGVELQVLDPGDAAALIAAGLVSTVAFPAIALRMATAREPGVDPETR